MKSILITGAYGGMGRETAMRFRDMGWRVFALDRVTDAGEENLIPIEADLTNEESIQTAVKTVAQMTDTTFLFISHQDAFTKMLQPTHSTTLSNGKIMVK